MLNCGIEQKTDDAQASHESNSAGSICAREYHKHMVKLRHDNYILSRQSRLLLALGKLWTAYALEARFWLARRHDASGEENEVIVAESRHKVEYILHMICPLPNTLLYRSIFSRYICKEKRTMSDRQLLLQSTEAARKSM